MTRFRLIVVAFMCGLLGAAHAEEGLAGKWRGTTRGERLVVLVLEVNGKALKGTLTIDEKTAEIAEGIVADMTFSFKATLEGQTMTFEGRRVGETLELSPRGARNPATLKRVE